MGAAGGAGSLATWFRLPGSPPGLPTAGKLGDVLYAGGPASFFSADQAMLFPPLLSKEQ